MACYSVLPLCHRSHYMYQQRRTCHQSPPNTVSSAGLASLLSLSDCSMNMFLGLFIILVISHCTPIQYAARMILNLHSTAHTIIHNDISVEDSACVGAIGREFSCVVDVVDTLLVVQ